MSWSTSELKVRLAPWNRFKPSSKIFYWPFQGGTSFVDILCFFLSCVCNGFVCVCLFVPCGHLLGKDWPLGPRLWCLTVSLSLSHWYPWSVVVLDCIDSWSLHPYFLCTLMELSVEYLKFWGYAWYAWFCFCCFCICLSAYQSWYCIGIINRYWGRAFVGRKTWGIIHVFICYLLFAWLQTKSCYLILCTAILKFVTISPVSYSKQNDKANWDC